MGSSVQPAHYSTTSRSKLAKDDARTAAGDHRDEAEGDG